MSNENSTASSPVIGLGYLGFHAANLQAWNDWSTGVLGLQQVAPPSGVSPDHLYLRMDERAWRFAIEPGETGAIAFTGWETAGPTGLEEVYRLLTNAGVAVVRDPELAKTRCVQDLIRCVDPDGFRLEFFHGQLVARNPFVSPRGVRFVTGNLGLGHILITVSDIEKTTNFYLNILRFRMTDFIEFGGNKVHFTRVNPRHHSLAFVQTRSGDAKLGHFMVEVDDIDAVGFALDRIHAGGGRVTETLGRHTNDLMLSFYCENPSGSQAEYGWGGRIVDDATWTVTSFDTTAFWGHKVPGSEYSETGPFSPRDGAE